MNAQPVRLDGQLVINIARAIGIDDWKTIHDMTLGPRAFSVNRYLRDEKGRFYKDPDTDDVAKETVIGVIDWPKDADEEG